MRAVTPAPRLVLVDDDPDILFSFSALLATNGFGDIRTSADGRDLCRLLDGDELSVVLLDLQMPDVSGSDLLEEVTAGYPDVVVVVVTGSREVDTAVACIRAGAFDYLSKPVDPDRFLTTVRNAVAAATKRKELAILRDYLLTGSLKNPPAFAPIKTLSDKMTSLFGYLEGVSISGEPVLVTGETGTGKELVARAIHAASGRKGECVAVNVAGLDDTMLTDTLFGHRKGAFTGAFETREGVVAQAAGGTLFLDEIGDLSPPSQVRLLRLLQEGEYLPLGVDIPRSSSARIVCATNRDLPELCTTGTFRRDLYYRLCTHRVRIPPLRERPEDIPLLFKYFMEAAAASLGKQTPEHGAELLHLLTSYSFPGNVRELRSLCYDAVARHRSGTLSPASFREAVGALDGETADPAPAPGGAFSFSSGRFPTFREMEKFLVAEALKQCSGNQGRAASLLGVTRQALNKRLCKRG